MLQLPELTLTLNVSGARIVSHFRRVSSGNSYYQFLVARSRVSAIQFWGLLTVGCALVAAGLATLAFPQGCSPIAVARFAWKSYLACPGYYLRRNRLFWGAAHKASTDGQTLTPGFYRNCRNIPIALIHFGENQDSGCKLLKNRLRTAWHQQKSSKIVRLGPTISSFLRVGIP
jgi:hypothetical protein